MTGRQLRGRQVELGVLAERIDRMGDEGGAALIVGEPGIGKSSLLAAAGDQARQAGSLILRTVGVQAESQLPFAGLHQLLRPLLGRADQLPSAQRRALSTAFGLADGPAAEPFLVALAALTLLTEAAAAQPAEETSIVAAVRQAADHGLHAVAWRLAAALRYYSVLHPGCPELMDSFQTGVTSARQVGDREGSAWMLYQLGIGLNQQGRAEEAAEHCRQALLGFDSAVRSAASGARAWHWPASPRSIATSRARTAPSFTTSGHWR